MNIRCKVRERGEGEGDWSPAAVIVTDVWAFAFAVTDNNVQPCISDYVMQSKKVVLFHYILNYDGLV